MTDEKLKPCPECGHTLCVLCPCPCDDLERPKILGAQGLATIALLAELNRGRYE